MNTFRIITTIVALASMASAADPPGLVNYQGRVSVNGVNFDGAGLFRFALIDSGGTTTYWSNDGTSVAGSQPTAAVGVTVTKGLYSVHLGDTMLANMTALDASTFEDNSAVYLRIWFDDGVNGVQLLTPDQRIVSSAFALSAKRANGVADGAITQAMLAPGVAEAVDTFMEFVTVGNAGNGTDPGNTEDPNIFGAVSTTFQIGKYEVTNDQYVVFLNAVAATDPHGLFDPGMSVDARGGIVRAGSSGSYEYYARKAMGNKPVAYPDWYSALRFCNWLHNGRPSGAAGPTTTEDGAYTLTGTTSVAAGDHPIHGANGRNAAAKFHLPSEDEWYKAAYHQPAALGGDTDDYWLYPTQSNSVPTEALVNPVGDIVNDDLNIANHNGAADWNMEDGNFSTVGSGGPGSASFYGAFDMGGNAWEWNEALDGSERNRRGGSQGGGEDKMQSLHRNGNDPDVGRNGTSFRVARP